MKVIDGLYFHELILLVLGILLFIAILVLLIIYAAQKRPVKELVLFFLVSVIMIGYPSIQKIVYDNGVITVEKLAKAISKDPSDGEQRNELEMKMRKMEKRAGKDPETLVEFGKAQAILGDTVNADRYVGKALRISPDFSDAKELQTRFNTPQVQIQKIMTEFEKNPENTEVKTELENKVSNFAVAPGSNASVMITASKAHALLGDTIKALLLADSALQKDNKNVEAAALKKRFSTNRILNR